MRIMSESLADIPERVDAQESFTSIRIKVGPDVDLLSFKGLRGVSPSGEFTPQKRDAIREAITPIIPLLKEGDSLKPLNTSLIEMYNSPTAASQWAEKYPKLFALFGDYLTRDISDDIFNDNAYLFRGLTFGDILVAAVVNEGYVISKGPYEYPNPPAVTQTTPYAREVEAYSKGKIEDRKTAERIFYALGLESFGFTVDQVMNSILMSPVVMRFVKPDDSRVRPYGGYTTFNAVTPPFNVSESTHPWQRIFDGAFNLSILDIYHQAEEATQRHVENT